MNQSTLQKIVKRSHQLLPRITHGGNRHFSYIMDGKHIVSWGVNNPLKTRPSLAKYYKWPFIHAEPQSIKCFPLPVSELRNLKMINVRIDGNGRLNMSKPCSGCQNFLAVFDLKEIWYTDENGEFKCLDGK